MSKIRFYFDEDTALPAVTRYSKNDEEEIYPILTTDSGVPHCSGNRCSDRFSLRIFYVIVIG
ncbi:MAG: hypothetical protein F6J86_12230 [Symploca sp. SIO1B1]|nr:hypothetical protein [Symploca sp. SIO1B1]